MALNKFEGRITVPTGGYTISVTDPGGTDAAITVAAGDYYLTSTTSILTALQNALNASGTLSGTYTVTIADDADTDTGKVTIACDQTYSLTWSSTALRDRLGWTGNISSKTTDTGTEQAEYLWLPNVNRTNPRSPVPGSTAYELGAQETDFMFSMAPTGASKRLYYNTRYVDSFAFVHVLGSKTWKALESTTNESLQKFYDDVIAPGRPFRYHPSRDDNAVYWTMVISDAGAFAPSAVNPNWVGAKSLWSVTYEMRKLV